MLPFNRLESINNFQSIITVANRAAQEEIKIYFSKRNYQPLRDYYFFASIFILKFNTGAEQYSKNN